MSSISTDNISTCANCGKGEESGIQLKTCTACKLVKYCNRECQIAHRPQHKKECKKRAAELHNRNRRDIMEIGCIMKSVSESNDDESLFKQPPKNEDCPICFLTIPTLSTGYSFQACCGKVICNGCIRSMFMASNDYLCPFCRAPFIEGESVKSKRLENLIEKKNDGIAGAMFTLGVCYDQGSSGLPQNHAKAIELWNRAGELGNTTAYYNLNITYQHGRGVPMDKKKAKHYMELAAMGGDAMARQNLGLYEIIANNMDRALKHFMIANQGGDDEALESIKKLYMHGYATKKDYEKALLSRQTYLDDIRSNQRDEAAAFDDQLKYY